MAAARAAWTEWRETSLTARSRVLFSFRELCDRHREDLARLVTAEHGKVLEDARGEVARGIEVVEFACGIAHLLKGEFSEDVSSGVDASSVRQPLGVVAGITPFNFPVMVPMWMYPVAIACGNAFVLKPSERDPSPSGLVADLWREAGLPEGVFSVVHGDAAAVDALLDHPGVAAVSFVGSTPVARHVYETATAAGKRVQSLGGAKNHAVVLPDADLEAAADALVAAGYGSAGERCMAVSAVVAVGDGDRLVERHRRTGRRPAHRTGHRSGLGHGPAHHPCPPRPGGRLSRRRRRRKGPTVVLDGRGVSVPGGEDGFFLGPSLVDRVEPEMTRLPGRDLRAGAVGAPGGHLEEAIDLVNANPYGNGAAIFTRDGARRPPLPAGGAGGDGRHQRGHPGAHGLLLVRRLEAVAVRRRPHPRDGGRPLLHPAQDGHHPLARGWRRVGRRRWARHR